jgi:hypothetical protein
MTSLVELMTNMSRTISECECGTTLIAALLGERMKSSCKHRARSPLFVEEHVVHQEARQEIIDMADKTRS